MYKLYIEGKFYSSYISMEVCLQVARKHLKAGEDIEIRQTTSMANSFINKFINTEVATNALPN